VRDGSFDTGGVVDASARVNIAGTDRAVESVSVSREIPSPLPSQVAVTGGFTATTGSVELMQSDRVTDRVGTPWTTPGYLSRGEPVGVWATRGGNEYKIFTGVTDGTRGKFSSPEHSVSIVDDTDKLNRPFNMDALSRVMPPSEHSTGDIRRLIGLHSSYFTNRVMRAAGFNITPPMDGFCTASVPLVGSLWPERGSLRDAYRTEDEFGAGRYNPGWSYEPLWGSMAVQNGLAIVRPDVSVYGGRITAERPLNLTMMVGSYHQTSAYIAAAWSGSTRQIRLAVTSARAVIAQTRDQNNNVVSIVGITEAEAPGYKAASLRVEVVDNINFRYRLRTDTGVEKTAIAARVFNTGFDNVDQFWVYAPNNRIAGAQMSYTSVAWAALNYQQTAWMSYPATTVQLNAIPGIESGNCLELLKAQSEATGAAFWIDEDGVLRWWTREQFTKRPVNRTLTAAEDLLDVAFRLDAQDVRRRVTVSYRQPTVSTTRVPSLVVHEGSNHELRTGDNIEEWITPGADEDWLQVDTSQTTIIGGGGTGPMNTGVGTFLGFLGLNADGDEMITSAGFTRTMSFNRVGSRTWRHVLTLQSVPSGVDRVVTRTTDNAALKQAYRNRGLPLVRAMGLVQWTDQSHTPGVTGPSWAPELEHDVSWFVQDPGEAQTLATWLAGELANPEPVVESVDIIPDPRLQLGDKVTLNDPDRTGTEITGVVTGITHSFGHGDHEMSLRLLVTSARAQGVTLTEFDQFHDGMTMTQVEALYAGKSLSTTDTYPLN
jgi:hypothetical protein